MIECSWWHLSVKSLVGSLRTPPSWRSAEFSLVEETDVSTSIMRMNPPPLFIPFSNHLKTISQPVSDHQAVFASISNNRFVTNHHSNWTLAPQSTRNKEENEEKINNNQCDCAIMLSYHGHSNYHHPIPSLMQLCTYLSPTNHKSMLSSNHSSLVEWVVDDVPGALAYMAGTVCSCC